MCAATDRCGRRLDCEESMYHSGAACCWRAVWEDYDECVWHARPVDPDTPKPPHVLQASRTDQPERLDDAYLPEATLDGMDFTACSLTGARLDGATFTDATLVRTSLAAADVSYAVFAGVDGRHAHFGGADLRGTRFFGGADCSDAIFERALLHHAYFGESSLPDATFRAATMPNATFDDATVTHAEFDTANLREATFTGTECRDAQFRDANLSNVRVTGGNLQNADFTEATLREAAFVDTPLRSAIFSDASLSYAAFDRLDASGGRFDGADLHGVELSRVDLQRATFHTSPGVTRFEDGLLDGVDIRGTDFRRTALYQTVFSDVRLNDNTRFDDTAVYETEAVPPSEDGIDRYEAAAYVHRRLETLYDMNALSDEASAYHVRKKETQRRRAGHQVLCEGRVSALPTYIVAWFNRGVVYYGESLPRLLLWWVVVPAAFTGAFVLTGVRVNGSTYRFVPGTKAPVSELISTVPKAAYVSLVTFVTIGSGNVAPLGSVGRILYSAEALLGTLLLALFVFVLGRKVER